MKYQKILGLVATASMFLTGCSTDTDTNNTWLSDPNAVHVSASVGSIFSRSNPSATEEAQLKSFNGGDIMGVSNNGKSLNYSFNGTDWQPIGSDYLLWDSNNLNFQCWYPADGKNSSDVGFIQEDQSSETLIAKSDYMTATKNLTAIPDSRLLEVALERKTARLILNIQGFNDQFTAETKVNHVRLVSKASTDTNEATTVRIKPLQQGDGSINTTYTALVAPGTIEANLYFGAEESAETPLVVKTGDLVAGKSYTYNLTVGKNMVTIGGVNVAEWGKDEIVGGETLNIPYVTFTADAEQVFEMIPTDSYEISNLEYSVNGGPWTTVEDYSPVVFGGDHGNLRLRGKNKFGTAYIDIDNNIIQYATIRFGDSDVKVACKGDIRTLVDWENYKTADTSSASFFGLFLNCTVLTSAPDLPATKIGPACYSWMFSGCTALVKAPDLPAKTLVYGCYYGMFVGCTTLENAPKLPAMTLTEQCYWRMFEGCTALETAPALPATTLAKNCYAYMFAGCIKLSTVTMLAPSADETTEDYAFFDNWLYDAGTKAKSRTLQLKEKAVYDALKANPKYLPARWQIGKCTVLDEYNAKITE